MNDNENINTQEKIPATPEWQEYVQQNTEDQKFMLGLYAQYNEMTSEQQEEFLINLQKQHGQEGVRKFLEGADEFERSDINKPLTAPKSR